MSQETANDIVATGRLSPLFDEDLAIAEPSIAAEVAGKRIIAIGGAGTIGAATVERLLDYAPRAVTVIDQNENALAELTRRLRARPGGLGATEFQALPIDYGAPIFAQFLAQEPAADLVLNFAAIKHVRSEKNAYSLVQMIDTNIVKFARLLRLLGSLGFCGRLFTVSTDKAANPTSFMGATKRLMEHVAFDLGAEWAPKATITSARFANVAFSNGPLLESFERRLALGQPLAAPRETRRYFVSRVESGQICAIAATHAPAGAIMFPRLDPERELIPLRDVAERFLVDAGYEPEFCVEERQAQESVDAARAVGRWPVLLTAGDTAGEKPFEEFVAIGEGVQEVGLPNLRAIERAVVPRAALEEAVARLELMAVKHPPSDQSVIKDAIALVEPAFLEMHRTSNKHLDGGV